MASSRISARFNDIADLGRTAGFDLGFRQLDSGPTFIPADVSLGEQVTLVRMTFNRAYHQLGTPPPGMKTFGVPLGSLRDWFGKRYQDFSILPFNVPSGIDGVSQAGFRAFTMSVSDHSIESASAVFQVPVADILVTPTTNQSIRNCRATQAVRRLLAGVFDDEGSRLDAEDEDEIIVALLHAAFADTSCEDNSPAAARSRAMSKALAYIGDNCDEPVSVRDLCSHTGVALRTLNRAFRERFGIGPKAYLVRQRLSGVRTQLISAAPGTLIADVANLWGFWHMGQFARDYRALFGELPSETPRRSRSSGLAARITS